MISLEKEEDELKDSVWAVFRENKTPYQFFHFLDGNTIKSYQFKDRLDYLYEENLIEFYKWQMFNGDQLIIQDGSTCEMEFQGKRTSFNKTHYYIENRNGRKFHMFLVRGDLMKRNGSM